jgi:hypothetical protein
MRHVSEEFIQSHVNEVLMSLKHPGKMSSKSTRGGGFMAFFEIKCASCEKKGLRTTGGKYTSANAGYCRACGVFVGFECAGKTGWHGWKRTCPACGAEFED